MKEELIKFETAKLAKEKGFDWKVNRVFNRLEKLDLFDEYDASVCNYNGNNTFTSCPTQSFLQKWLRDVHDIHIQVFPEDDIDGNRIWTTSLFQLNYGQDKEVHWLSREQYTKSYEDGLEIGLQEALKRI
jgi:hypothetical protein